MFKWVAILLVEILFQCIPASRRSHLKLQHKLTVDDVPLTGTCSFKVLVFIGGYIYRWSDHKSCIRNLSSGINSFSTVLGTHNF